MNSIILKDEEIAAINSLLEEVDDVPLIECVYVRPIITGKGAKAEIRVLITDDGEYNELIHEQGFERNVKDEIKVFNSLTAKYETLFNNIVDGNCILEAEESENYAAWFTTYEEGLAGERLVNGTILYDRFGKFSFIQEKNEIGIDKNPNLPSIENIDEIIDSEDKNSSK